MENWDWEVWYDLIFLILLVTVTPLAGWFAYTRAKRDFENAKNSLEDQGYVVEQRYRQDRGPITCIWGRFTNAIPLYLNVTDLDTVEVLAGRIGINDLKIGDAKFDRRFVIRSNQHELCTQLLQADIREQLCQFESVQFLTCSLDSQIGADYWPKQKHGRDQREFWMLKVPGKLETSTAANYAQFVQGFAQKIFDACQDQKADLADYITTRYEGR